MLAKSGTTNSFVGPESLCVKSYALFRHAIEMWLLEEHASYRKMAKGMIHCKKFIKEQFLGKSQKKF